jgi:7-cyano-7-deazaguanine synthase
MKAVICTSGGVDSTIAWFYLGKPQAVYFDLGTKYTEKEIKCLNNLKQIIPDFDYTLDDSLQSFGKLEEGVHAFIPFRNLLFATACAANYEADEVVMAGIKDDNVCDKSPAAFRAMSNCLTKVNVDKKPVKVSSPFWKMDKVDIVKLFVKSEPNAIEILKTSVSCYSKTPGSCGDCPSCIRKWAALTYAGIECDSWFEKNPINSPLITDYLDNMCKDTDNEKFNSKRKNKFVKVLKKKYPRYRR